MPTFVLCVRCGEPLYGFSPCRWYTCEWCRNDLLDGFCSLCNSRNSCVYDPNSNSFDCPPDSSHPLHLTYETYSFDSCGNDSHLSYDCQPQFQLNYGSKPGYIQNYNSYPHDSPSFLQQYLCCDNCGGLHETFQCQPMNQNFYNSNSFGFDQSQPSQFPIIHQPPQETSIKILHDQENAINCVQNFLRKFNRYSFFETPKVLLLAWDRVFKIKDAFGNKQYKSEDIQELFRKLFNDVQNIHEELAEYINTLSWNRPAFYNDGEDDDEDYAIAITPDFLIMDSLIMGDEHLYTIPEKESDEFIKSSVETLVPNPSEFKDECECDIDSLLAEFVGELIFLKSIPLRIDEANCEPEEDIHLVEILLYDNSSPRIEEDDDDSERDILILEELLSNYSHSLPENESFHFDIPSLSRPPTKPPDGNTGILNIKMMGDISEQKVPMLGLMITRVLNQEKSPDLIGASKFFSFSLNVR
nr:hypothetical protein [Tanacetum cinerariifolium]